MVTNIEDVRKSKEAKEKELAFYRNELAKTRQKLSWLTDHLKTTQNIINLIESE